MYESAAAAELRTVLAVNRKGVSAEGKLAVLGRGMWSSLTFAVTYVFHLFLTSIREKLSKQCLPAACRA